MTSHDPSPKPPGTSLGHLVPDDLATVDVAAAMRAGRRRQRERRVLGGGLGLIGAAAVAVLAFQVLPGTTSVPAVPGSPSTTSGPAVSCPTPDATWEPGIAGYAEGVHWGGDLLARDPQATGTRGALAGTVPCDVVAIQDDAQRVYGGRWPDGSSQANLPIGTPLYWDASRPQGCALMAQRDGIWLVFVKDGC